MENAVSGPDLQAINAGKREVGETVTGFLTFCSFSTEPVVLVFSTSIHDVILLAMLRQGIC
jgi:hypothetical protein